MSESICGIVAHLTEHLKKTTPSDMTFVEKEAPESTSMKIKAFLENEKVS